MYSYFGKGTMVTPPPAGGTQTDPQTGQPFDRAKLNAEKDAAKIEVQRALAPFRKGEMPKCGKPYADALGVYAKYQEIRIRYYSGVGDPEKVATAQRKLADVKDKIAKNFECGAGPLSIQSSEDETQAFVSDETQAFVSDETRAIQSRLAMLRQQVAAKRAAEDARIAKVKETHAKQAAYGRDTKQIRPKRAGYATEAEKIMGGGTGYHAQPKPKAIAGLGGLGDAVKDVDYAANELEKQTELVKQIAADVKAGVATKSELENAIQELRRKAAIAKSTTKELSGFGEGGEAGKFYILLAVLGVAGMAGWWFLRGPGKA